MYVVQYWSDSTGRWSRLGPAVNDHRDAYRDAADFNRAEYPAAVAFPAGLSLIPSPAGPAQWLELFGIIGLDLHGTTPARLAAAAGWHYGTRASNAAAVAPAHQ